MVKRGLALSVLLGMLAISAVAAARPGGGHSFGGRDRIDHDVSGSSHDFSSSDDDDGFGHGGGFASSDDDDDLGQISGGFPSDSRSDSDYSSSNDDGGSDIGGIVFLAFVGCIGLAGLGWHIHAMGYFSWESAEPVDYHEFYARQRNGQSRGLLDAPQGGGLGSPKILHLPPEFYAPEPQRPSRGRFDALREHDPNFSPILLEDFLYELYIRAQEARRSAPGVARLSPYFAENVRAQLQSRRRHEIAAVQAVIVGACRVVGLRDLLTGVARIQVEYESNFTERYAAGTWMGFWAHERWTLRRKLGATSPPPNELRAFDCPSCGAAIDTDELEACQHCGTVYAAAEHDWYVEAIEILGEETRGPGLTSYAEEAGTYRMTVMAPDRELQLAALKTADPAFTEADFNRRVALVYEALNEGWSKLDWDSVRPFTTDRFWRAQRYWIAAYEEQGLRNEMTDATIHGQEIVKVERDPFFHAITLRLTASAVDRTVLRSDGAHVTGSFSPRRYSEYWTFIRSVERKGKASADKRCPSCSAPLSVNMSGRCTHCNVMVAGGAFDWSLSKIEQDEVYAG